MKKILVTGGSGFVGSSFIEKYKKDYEIWNIGRSEVKDIDNIHWDMTEPFPSTYPDDFKTIIHTAAVVEGDMSVLNTVNVEATAELLKRFPDTNFIFLSSGAVYGSNLNRGLMESDCCTPRTPYAITKFAAEMLVRSHGGTSLRLFFPYGARSNMNRIIAKIINTINHNGRFVINDMNINPIYIDDLCMYIKKFVDLPPMTGAYNVAGPDIVSISDIVEIIKKELNKEVAVMCRDTKRNMIGDTTRLRRLTGYPEETSFLEGIQKTLKTVV